MLEAYSEFAPFRVSLFKETKIVYQSQIILQMDLLHQDILNKGSDTIIKTVQIPTKQCSVLRCTTAVRYNYTGHVPSVGLIRDSLILH